MRLTGKLRSVVLRWNKRFTTRAMIRWIEMTAESIRMKLVISRVLRRLQNRQVAAAVGKMHKHSRVQSTILYPDFNFDEDNETTVEKM